MYQSQLLSMDLKGPDWTTSASFHVLWSVTSSRIKESSPSPIWSWKLVRDIYLRCCDKTMLKKYGPNRNPPSEHIYHFRTKKPQRELNWERFRESGKDYLRQETTFAGGRTELGKTFPRSWDSTFPIDEWTQSSLYPCRILLIQPKSVGPLGFWIKSPCRWFGWCC